MSSAKSDKSIEEEIEWHYMGTELGDSKVGSNSTRAGLLPDKHEACKIFGI
jgi:hypothetical protein